MSKATIRRVRDEQGMTTAEYAVGTIASCGIAGVLISLLDQPWISDLLKSLFDFAMGAFF